MTISKSAVLSGLITLNISPMSPVNTRACGAGAAWRGRGRRGLLGLCQTGRRRHDERGEQRGDANAPEDGRR